MEGNIENFGKVTFKVKLVDEYHDFVLEWSEENQCYEGQQLFKQLESITGIPVKYTSDMVMHGNPHPAYQDLHIYVYNRESELYKYRLGTNVDYLCNNLAKEVMRCKSQLDCDSFVLIFKMCFIDKNFYIYYEMITSLVVDAECLSRLGFCHFANTKVILERMRSIITNDELNAQVKDALPDYLDIPGNVEAERYKVYINFNVRQYTWMACSTWPTWRHSHWYLRYRG